MPEKLQELVSDYGAYVEKNGVIDLPLDYEWAKEMQTNTIKRNVLPLLGWAILVVTLIGIIAVMILRKK